MPWLLLGLGLAIVVYVGAIRTDLHTDSTICVERVAPRSGAAGHQRSKQVPGAKKPSKAGPNCSGKIGPKVKLRVTRQTITKRIPSDALVAGIFGAGAILMLAGAFYSRVTKITIAGSGIEMTEAERRDAVDVSKAVQAQVESQVEQLLAAKGGTADPKRVSEAVTRTAAATAIAQEEARELRMFAAGSTFRAPIALEPERLQDLRKGNPLPPDVLERLAKRAVDEAFTEPDGG